MCGVNNMWYEGRTGGRTDVWTERGMGGGTDGRRGEGTDSRKHERVGGGVEGWRDGGVTETLCICIEGCVQ